MQQPVKTPLEMTNYELYEALHHLNKVHIFYFFFQAISNIPFFMLLTVVIPGMWYSYGVVVMIKSIVYGLLGIQFGSTMFWIEKLVRRRVVTNEMQSRNLPHM